MESTALHVLQKSTLFWLTAKQSITECKARQWGYHQANHLYLLINGPLVDILCLIPGTLDVKLTATHNLQRITCELRMCGPVASRAAALGSNGYLYTLCEGKKPFAQLCTKQDDRDGHKHLLLVIP